MYHYYDGSLYNCLQDLYPNHKWDFWRFTNVPNKMWTAAENRREFLDWVAKELKLDSMEKWYFLSPKQVKELGGAALLNNYFGGSLAGCLMAVYPDHPWMPWRFVTGPPKNYWDTNKHQKRFFEWAANELNIQSERDWDKVTKHKLVGLGGSYAIAVAIAVVE
jgi:hypothetical protein